MVLRRMAMAGLTTLAILIPCGAASPQAGPPPARLVAVGDVHGDLESFKAILRQAGIIDASTQWSGGSATFVQTGDYLDRGFAIRDVLDLLMALERAAPAAGGRAVVLLGNHEAMNLVSDLRDVSPKAFASFADTDSEGRRKRAFRDHRDWARKVRERYLKAHPDATGVPVLYGVPDETAWMTAHPPGWLEYVEAMGPESRYGRWLRDRRPSVQIDGTIFLHGGLDPAVVPDSVDAINETVGRSVSAFDQAKAALVKQGLAVPWLTVQELVAAAVLGSELVAAEQSGDRPETARPASFDGVAKIGESWLLAPEGPLWFRGFAQWSDEQGLASMPPLLQRFGARRVVVGHTVLATHRITPRFDSRVVLIDTGMNTAFFKEGRASALEIAGDSLTAIYAEGRETLTGTAR